MNLRHSLWPVRVGLAVVVTVYLVYSSFGIAHPCLWGHMGHHEAEYMMRVRSTFRHHMVTPATHAGYDTPPWNTFYFHHPIGYHHLLGAFTLIVGDHIWTPTVFPALTGLFTIWALFALVRRWWSREAALLAVAVWVGLPIIASFSILTDAMFPAMACSIATMDLYLRYTEEPSARRLKRALLVQFIGGMLFWEAYFQAFFLGILILIWWATARGRQARITVLGRSLPAAPVWFFATGALAVLMLASHLTFLWAKGMWTDFLESYTHRHGGHLDFVIERHKLWLQTLYGWPLVAIGLTWIAVFFTRLALGQARKRDQAVWMFWVINTFYIYLFKQGSALHLYRVFWYSTFLVLSVVDLTVDLRRLVGWLVPGKVGKPAGLAVAAAAVLTYFWVETPHTYANLLESRVMMGTHTHPGYNPDYSKQRFAQEVAKRTGPEDHVIIHANLPRRVEFWYYLDRTNVKIRSLAEVAKVRETRPRAVVLMDAHPPPAERRLALELMKRHPATMWDRYIMIDLRSNHPEFHEYVFKPVKPSSAWRWFVSHAYPPLVPRETATTYGACVYANTQVKPPSNWPDVPRPSIASGDLFTCWHNFQLLRGRADLADAARIDLVRAGLKSGARVPFGEVALVRNITRSQAEVWFHVAERPGPLGRVRWMLYPAAGGPSVQALATDIGDTALADSAPGFLQGQRLMYSAKPGKYTLVLEPGPPYQSVEVAELELK